MQRSRGLVVAWLVALWVSGALPAVVPSESADMRVSAQTDLTQRVDELNSRVRRIESRVDRNAGAAVAFLFGAFCALWAQNTKRSPWAWFFLGVFFNVITVLVLLAKNADDRRAANGAPSTGSRAVVLAVILGILIVVTFLLLYWRAA